MHAFHRHEGGISSRSLTFLHVLQAATDFITNCLSPNKGAVLFSVLFYIFTQVYFTNKIMCN